MAGLRIFAGGQSAVLDLDLLAGVLPVIITGDKNIAAEKLERRVGQGAGQAEVGQGRSEGADDHLLVHRTGRDHAADEDAVAALHAQAGGDVQELCPAAGRDHIDDSVHAHRVMGTAVVGEIADIVKGEGENRIRVPDPGVEHSIRDAEVAIRIS